MMFFWKFTDKKHGETGVQTMVFERFWSKTEGF